MTPATPLPWDGVPMRPNEQTAAYIVHACNAYPALINTLSLIANGEAVRPHIAAQIILRELGEF